MRYLVLVGLCVLALGAVEAGGLEKGDNEVAFEVLWSDTDFGSSSGSDLGSSEQTDLSLSYGWMVTARHEFGLLLGYFEEDLDGGDLFEDVSTDGTRLGGFYNFNFGATGMATPYVGAALSTLGGDLGDAFDLQYAVEVGVKLYPFDHGGVSIGLGYSELKADAPGLPDADALSLGIGLLLKY